jgi:NADH dehydrogenase (ubiquinone) 1 alpha subcomplex subunit 6
MILDSMSLATRLPQTLKQVRPVLSADHAEAKRRVLNLYKIWLRQIPYIRVDYIKNNWTEARLRDVIKVKNKIEFQ